MEKSCSVVVTYRPDVAHLKDLLFDLMKTTDVFVFWNDVEPPNFQIDGVRIFHLQKNIGLASAQNYIFKIIGTKYRYAFLFDQDSKIGKSYTRSMIEYLGRQTDDRVVSVSPCIKDERTGHFHRPIRHGWLGFPVKSDVNSNSEIYIGINSGLLIDLSRAGSQMYFCDELFIDHIDTEWFLRTQKLGYIHMYNANVTLEHSIGDETYCVLGTLYPVHKNYRKVLQYRNLIYLILYKDLPLPWKIKEGAYLLPKVILFGLKTHNLWQNICNLFAGANLAVRKEMGPL